MNALDLSHNQLKILQIVSTYYAITRTQINRHWYPKDDGRIVRKWLQKLVSLSLIRRNQMQVVNSQGGRTTPVYSPTEIGKEHLLCLEGSRWQSICTRTPQWQYLQHWTDLTECYIRLRRALQPVKEVRLVRWINEWQEVNPGAPQPAERFTLYTKLTDRIVFNPDAAFALAYPENEICKVYFVELDRGTTATSKIAATKAPGVKELVLQQYHRKIFPETTHDSVTVLHISPNERRIERVRHAFQSKAKDSCHLWKFVCFDDWGENLLQPVIFDIDGQRFPLVRTDSAVSSGPAPSPLPVPQPDQALDRVKSLQVAASPVVTPSACRSP